MSSALKKSSGLSLGAKRAQAGKAPTVQQFATALITINRFYRLASVEAKAGYLRALPKAAATGPKGTVRLLTNVEAAVGDALRAMRQNGKATRDTLDAQAARFNELRQAGEILPTSEFLDRLKVTHQALSKAVLANRVFFLESEGVKSYPAFYVDGRYDRGPLEDVTRLLGNLPGGSKWIYFTTPKGSLAKPGQMTRDGREDGIPRTPLQALVEGELECVKATAIAYAER